MLTIDEEESAIRSISVLSPVPGSAGQGRSQANTLVVARVILADGRTALVRINTNGNPVVQPLLASERTLFPANVTANPLYKGFGIPAVGSAGSNFVALSTLAAGEFANSGNDTALVFSSNGAIFTPFAREGATAADAGSAKYQGFLDPLTNSLGDVAFVGTLAGQGVTAKNRTALWWGNPNSPLEIVARTGSPAAEPSGAEGEASYAGFASVALPGGANAGPVFLATLNGPGVSKKTNLGLWALDSNNVVRRLLKTGDILKTDEFKDDEQVSKTVARMTLLQALPGAFGATRSVNENGGVVVLVGFTDKTQAVITLGIP